MGEKRERKKEPEIKQEGSHHHMDSCGFPLALLLLVFSVLVALKCSSQGTTFVISPWYSAVYVPFQQLEMAFVYAAASFPAACHGEDCWCLNRLPRCALPSLEFSCSCICAFPQSAQWNLVWSANSKLFTSCRTEINIFLLDICACCGISSYGESVLNHFYCIL